MENDRGRVGDYKKESLAEMFRSLFVLEKERKNAAEKRRETM